MQNELQQLLTDLAAERVSLIERHEAGARAVSVDVTKDLVARLEELLGPGTTVIDHAGRA